MRSLSWTEWAPYAITCVLVRQTHRGEDKGWEAVSHVTTEAETGGTRPQAKSCRQPPEAGRDRRDPCLEPLKGAQPCQYWDFSPVTDFELLAPEL